LGAAERVDEGIERDHRTDVPVSWFSYELLPDWYEDWVTFERERFRLLALHALEGMAASHTDQGRYRDAVECSLAAVRLEPLRESSHRALVSAHIAQGNLAEAVRQYHRYRDLLLTELGVEPTYHMNEILLSAGLSGCIVNVA
jgi:DNA-binding SARP family transcriptional activator